MPLQRRYSFRLRTGQALPRSMIPTPVYRILDRSLVQNLCCLIILVAHLGSGGRVAMQKAIGTQEQEILQELLKACRLEAGLTQRDLAARLNTIHTRIGGYERGERRLDLVQLDEYMTALEIPLVQFVQRYVDEVAKRRGK